MFMNDSQQYILDDEREELVQFSNARLAFYQQNFLESIEYLSQPIVHNRLVKLNWHILRIKNYFHLMLDNDSYVELVHSLTDNFERLLHREQHISERSLERYKNFIHFLKQLLRAYYREPKVDSIRKKMQDTTRLAHSNWLFQMVDLLENRNRSSNRIT